MIQDTELEMCLSICSSTRVDIDFDHQGPIRKFLLKQAIKFATTLFQNHRRTLAFKVNFSLSKS